MKTRFLLFLFTLTAASPAFATVTIKPQTQGLVVTSDSDTIHFTLGYPVLLSADTKKTFKATSVHVTSETAAVLNFDGGGELDITVDSTGTMVVKESNLPQEAHSIQFRMDLPISWRGGTTWQAGDAAPQPFPADQASKPHMYQGSAPTLVLRDGDGKGVTITIQKFSYQEVNDERPWGTQSFAWMTQANNADTLVYTFTDAAPPPAPAPAAASTNAAPNP